MNRLDGKVAIITGAAQGIGRVSAQLFADEGAQVVVADISKQAGNDTVAAIKANGGEAIFVWTDVTDEQSVVQCVREAKNMYGGVHVLYNNAGGSTKADKRVTEAPVEEFWRAIKLDLFGTWLCCRSAIPSIIASGGGAVINTCSVVIKRGTLDRDAYTASKGAIAALTQSMALEYGRQNVRVNAIAPSATRTERVSAMLAESPYMQAFVDEHHMFGVVEPIDVARAALYFASEDARVTTGQILFVDSGATI